MKFIFHISIIMFLIGCADPNEDTRGKILRPSAEDTVGIVYSVSAPHFHRYLYQEDSTYNTRKYISVAVLPLDLNIAEELDTVLIKTFRPWLSYNKAKTKALDLFSSNYVMTQRSGSPHAVRGEPDTELAIIDFKTGTRIRLLYVGPSYLLTDALWINDSTIGVTGGEVINDRQMQPLLWEINLENKTVAHYRYPDTLQVQIAFYLQERYPVFSY